MPFLILFAAVLIGYAYWKQKIKAAQIVPIVVGIAGLLLIVKGAPIPGIIATCIAAAWYRGLTLRLFGKRNIQTPEYRLRDARSLLGASIHDDADIIRARHRKLIAASHPDVGGNKDRASALNEARDLLLAHLAKPK
jgi:hypothetical protein